MILHILPKQDFKKSLLDFYSDLPSLILLSQVRKNSKVVKEKLSSVDTIPQSIIVVIPPFFF